MSALRDSITGRFARGPLASRDVAIRPAAGGRLLIHEAGRDPIIVNPRSPATWLTGRLEAYLGGRAPALGEVMLEFGWDGEDRCALLTTAGHTVTLAEWELRDLIVEAEHIMTLIEADWETYAEADRSEAAVDDDLFGGA